MYSLDYSDAILLYYLFFTKVLPIFVTYFCDKFFNIKIKFKSISLLNACIQNICVKWSGYEITVGELGLKSKYLSSEYKRPLCIEIEDVKIKQTFDDGVEGDIEARTQKSMTLEAKYEAAKKKNEVDDDDRYMRSAKDYSTQVLNYLLQFLPPTAMIILQFLGVRVRNFTATVLNKERGPVVSLSVPSIDLTFDGCVVKNNRTLFIALALQHIRSKFFAYNKQNPSRKPHQPCLAEIVVDLSLEARVAWSERKLLYEKLHVSINSTQITFNGGLFDIIEHFMLHTKPKVSPTPAIEFGSTSDKIDASVARVDVEKLIETLTPDLVIVHIEHTEVKSLNKENSFHYHLFLQRVELKGRFKASNSSRVKISNLRIYTPADEVLHLKELSIDVKLSGNVFVFAVKLDTLNLVYNHDDIYGWFLKIFLAGMKSNRRELIVQALHMMTEKMIELYHSEFTQKLFSRIVLNSSVELSNVSLVFQLGDNVSSLNVSKAKFLLEQSDNLRKHFYEDYTLDLLFKNRHWGLDLSADGPFCWYMDQKFDYLNCDSKKTYIRGSALYVASAQVHLGCHDDDVLQLKLRVNSLRTEYSQKLTNFTIKSIKSFKEYFELFSQLKRVGDEADMTKNETISIEEVLKKLRIDARISDIACFFINRHDVCAFMNLSQISSDDSFNYTLDTFQVSTVDFSKYDSVYDLMDFSSVYVSTKTLRINLFASNDQPQIGVDFVEKLECKWDAHFLRHLLSLIRDFHKFRRNAEDAWGISREYKSLLPRSLPVGLDIKKLRNIRIKHADVNVDKLILLINELSGENLFFYHYFN